MIQPLCWIFLLFQSKIKRRKIYSLLFISEVSFSFHFVAHEDEKIKILRSKSLDRTIKNQIVNIHCLKFQIGFLKPLKKRKTTVYLSFFVPH